MSLLHWNYFLVIEEDLGRLSRYVEFNLANNKTYSIEMARILMASVLLDAVVYIPRYDLEMIPFEDWKNNTTPDWWTANNKIKHSRHEDFFQANLENALKSIAALFLSNLYYYIKIEDIQPFPNPKLLDPGDLVWSVTPSSQGNSNNYKLI